MITKPIIPKGKCGQWLDMRDLGQVFDHVGELPHAKVSEAPQ